ncbi:MAG: hypothetical protein AVDCRST_MAG18-1459 [uncultured Thermomicrobiales bacterium]|uniref:Uncharacterized protein n=1 Tax=uncultured Thermomicrobiales bacterium TaxID=1645740 RepID=A0A6J4V3D9_9BACT|nr:MAG: hypothetical protein AVDCRST_MAG18-1459 [uncultured Thermomicrobiales bacterium]
MTDRGPRLGAGAGRRAMSASAAMCCRAVSPSDGVVALATEE